MPHLDTTDQKILEALQADARMTTKQLAEKIHLSVTPTYERVKRLERDGYISGYVAILDRAKLDLGLMVICHVTLRQHTREIGEQFVQQIQSLPEVIECHNTSGEYDFMLKILVKDMPAYQNFVLNKLGATDHIGHTHSVFVMGTIKESYGIPVGGQV